MREGQASKVVEQIDITSVVSKTMKIVISTQLLNFPESIKSSLTTIILLAITQLAARADKWSLLRL